MKTHHGGTGTPTGLLWWNLAFLPCVLGSDLQDDSRYLADPKGERSAAYVIVAADAFAGDCDALLDHREKRGLKAAVVRASDVFRAYGDGKPAPEAVAAFVKHAAERWGAKFVLLAGDADALPPFTRKSEYQTDKFPNEEELATDHPYADAGVSVGRFPAATKEQLAAMIAKTVDYETRAAPGPWQRKISLIAGEGGFGSLLDSLIEKQVRKIVTTMIPPAYEIEFTYAKPASPYCPYPPQFGERMMQLLNEGPLFCVYLGHGSRTGLDPLVFDGKAYPILEAADAARLRIGAASPVLIAIACNAGQFDSGEGDCLGEALLKSRTGPVVFIGGSRITQPYGNALLGRALIDACLQSKPTIGEALFEAKRRALEKDDSVFRKTVDGVAGSIQGFDSLEPMRKDVVMHYNLLGDPAMAIRRPAAELTVEARREGARVLVKGTAPIRKASAIISLDCLQDAFLRPPAKIDPAADDLPARYLDRYKAANGKSAARAEAAVADGAFEVELAIPAGTPKGRYLVRVIAWDETACAAGVCEVAIEK